MKIRNGFVSNSSSSSFLCNICGQIESGFDCSLSDFEMEQCEHGHQFHLAHAERDFRQSATKEEQYQYLRKHFVSEKEETEQDIQDLQNMINGTKKIPTWYQKDIERNPNYLQEKIEYYKQKLITDNENIEDLDIDYKDMSDEDFDDEYGDVISEYIYDTGVPESFCPVCAKLKEYEQDAEWQKYKELQEKFNGVCF